VGDVVPVVTNRDLSYTYAEHHCDWLIDHLAATEMPQQGFVVCDAAARSSRRHACQWRLRIGGNAYKLIIGHSVTQTGSLSARRTSMPLIGAEAVRCPRDDARASAEGRFPSL
jgi:hypothetical protein